MDLNFKIQIHFSLKKQKKFMRAFIISDTHFGARSNNIEWLNLMLDFFNKQFIPYVKKHKKPDDILIHCGDVFDSRQALNLTVMSRVIELFTELNEIFGQIYIIPGNHDVARKTDNEITSLDCLKFIPNLKIFKEPTEIEFDNQKVLFMPWMHGLEKEKETLSNYKYVDYVFCHADFSFASFDGIRTMSHGITEKDIIGEDYKIKTIYSGHIHHRQRRGILNLVGNPYQMTRSDKNNDKGFWVLDFKTEQEYFIPNVVTPKFRKIVFNREILNKTVEEFYEICFNNRIDLYIPTQYLGKAFNSFILNLGEIAKSIEIFPTESNFENDTENDDANYTQGLNLIESFSKLVESKFNDKKLKKKLDKKFETLFKKFEK